MTDFYVLRRHQEEPEEQASGLELLLVWAGAFAFSFLVLFCAVYGAWHIFGLPLYHAVVVFGQKVESLIR